MSKNSTPNPNEEIDLIQLFKAMGKGINKIIAFFGWLFFKLFLGFVWFVFFIKKHFIKLAIAALLGFGYGFLKERITQPSYRTSAIIKQNYSTGEALYNNLEYYDELIKNKDTDKLAQLLNVDSSQISKIMGFEMSSMLNRNQKLKLYDKYLKEVDSTITKDLLFDGFLENMDDFNFPIQKISIISNDNSQVNNIIDSLVSKISNLEYFKNQNIKDLNNVKFKKKNIIESLKESDSLQKIYQTVLLEQTQENTKTGGLQTSITFENSTESNVTKEYELYQSDINLRNQLANLNKEEEDYKHIIEVVSNEQNKGTLERPKVFGFTMDLKIGNMLVFVVLTLLALLALTFLKFLSRYKDNVS